MDANRYPEPRTFNPDRYQHDFLNAADSAASREVAQRDHFGFGAGRRICQGMHVAERNLFLGISRLLWGFDIEPTRDSKGKDILPDPDKYTQGFVVMPEPFQARIIPRSKAKADAIKRLWNEAQSELDPQSGQWKEDWRR